MFLLRLFVDLFRTHPQMISEKDYTKIINRRVLLATA